MRVFLAILLTAAICAVSSGTRIASADESGAPPSGAPSAGGASPAPTPPGKATPSSLMKFGMDVVFAIGIGKDEATNAKVAVAMANKLEKALRYPVVPEGDWTLQDYIDQCAKDPHTKGAFIVLPPGSGSKTDDYLVLIRQAVSVEFNAMVSECLKNEDPAKQAGEPDYAPEVAWVSQSITGEYGRSVVQFLPFAVLTSVYLAFAPQRTYQTVTTRNYPTPNPLPSGGANSSVQTTNQSILNASGTSGLQNSVITSVAASTLRFGREGDTNHLTLKAAEAAAFEFTKQFQAYCRDKSGDGFCAWQKAGQTTPSSSKSP